MLVSYQIIVTLYCITAIQTMKLSRFGCIRSCISACADCAHCYVDSNAVTIINFTSVEKGDQIARAQIISNYSHPLLLNIQSSESPLQDKKVRFGRSTSESSLLGSGPSILKSSFPSPVRPLIPPFPSPLLSPDAPISSYDASSTQRFNPTTPPDADTLPDTFPRIPPRFISRLTTSTSTSSFQYKHQHREDCSVTADSSASAISLSSALFRSSDALKRMAAITEIGSQHKLISGIDCESIIDLIPIESNVEYAMHPFWKEHPIESMGIKEYVISQCWNRFHELYDLDVAEIQMQVLKAKKNKNARNLVVFDLEKTVLDYVEDHDGINLAQIAKYNDDEQDLVFAYINMNGTEHIDDQFSEHKDAYLVMFRRGLMKLLYKMVCGEIEDNHFDSMVFVGSNSYVSFFNIILIEMYFNWYYLLTLDPLLSAERHHELFFKFEFVIPLFRRSKYKKSLHGIENILQKRMDLYDRIIIIDYNSDGWDHRFPSSPRKVWGNVFGIKANKIKINTSATSMDWIAKRDGDTFLFCVQQFIVDIKLYSKPIHEGTNGCLFIDWCKIDKHGLSIVPDKVHQNFFKVQVHSANSVEAPSERVRIEAIA